MRHGWLWIGVGLTLLVGPRATAAPAVDLPRLVVRLRGTDFDDAAAALRDLLAAGPKARQRAVTTLTELTARRVRLRDDARRRLGAITRGLQDEARVKAVMEALDRHKEAADEAVRFAFDNDEYAVPAKARTGWSPGRDYQKGQVLLEGRVEVAIGRFNLAEAKVLALFGYALPPKRPGGGGFGRAYLAGKLRDPGRPLAVLRYNIVDSGPAWAQVGASLASRCQTLADAEEALRHTREWARQAGVGTGKGDPAATDGDAKPQAAGRDVKPQAAGEAPPLARAAAALFAGRYDEAARLRPGEGAPARLFDLLARRCVLVRSAKRPGGWTRSEKEAVHLLNLYRLSLGLCPLMANPKIYAAASEHSQWQDSNNQMTHTREEKGKRSPGDRLRARGYRWGGSENIAGGRGDDAIWSWRADAGHHRNLINPRHRACAIARSGRFVTYDAGSKMEVEGLADLVR